MTTIESMLFSITAAGVNNASIVAPPPLVPSPVNLVRSSRNPSDPSNSRWTSGITYRPLAAGNLTLESDCAPVSVGMPVEFGAEIIYWQPYVLQAEIACSLMGFDSADATQRVSNLLDAATPKMVEFEFWHGELAAAAAWDNLALETSSSVQTSYDATSTAQAIGICEQYLASMGYGGRGMIHIPPYLSAFLPATVRREGNLLLTNMDTIIVPGNGYGDIGTINQEPTLPPTTLSVFATGITDVRLGEIVAVPSDFNQSIDRSTNSVSLRAERYALASWDGFANCRVDISQA
jgi:hypothetical protein